MNTIYEPSTPFVYLIGWTKHDTWYYGVRYAKGCKPSDLWVRYFTSSKHVRTFAKEHGNPDVIEVRKVFEDPLQARLYESRVNRRLTVKSERFLNKHDGGIGWSTYNKVPCVLITTGEDVIVTCEEFTSGKNTKYRSKGAGKPKNPESVKRANAANTNKVRCRDLITNEVVTMTKREFASRDKTRFVFNSAGRKQQVEQVTARSVATSNANTGMIPVFDSQEQTFTRVAKELYWAQPFIKRYFFTASKEAKAFICKMRNIQT